MLDPNLTSHFSELMRCPTFETDGTLVMRPYVTEEEGGSEIGAGVGLGTWVGAHFLVSNIDAPPLVKRVKLSFIHCSRHLAHSVTHMSPLY